MTTLKPRSDETVAQVVFCRLSAGIAFHDYRIGVRRFVDAGDAQDQPVLDFDTDRHVVGESDATWLGGTKFKRTDRSLAESA